MSHNHQHNHHHDDHSHGHGHDSHGGHHDHDHSSDIQPALQSLLYSQIEFQRIITYNETQTGSGAAIVKKTWAERLQSNPTLVSDADEQLLMNIPFAGTVRLHSILLRTSASESAPRTLHVFVNRDDLDFSTANDLKPTQSFELSQTNEIQDIPVRRALFGNAYSLSLFFADNHGDDASEIFYLGFKGEFTRLNREPVEVLYEAAANPTDHVLTQGIGQGVGSTQLGN